MSRICAWAGSSPDGIAIVTTQKDLVKLRLSRLAERPLWCLRIRLRVRVRPGFAGPNYCNPSFRPTEGSTPRADADGPETLRSERFEDLRPGSRPSKVFHDDLGQPVAGRRDRRPSGSTQFAAPARGRPTAPRQRSFVPGQSRGPHRGRGHRRPRHQDRLCSLPD